MFRQQPVVVPGSLRQRDSMPEFRFAYNIFELGSAEDFAATCRRAEQHGYDTAFAADHLGIAAPFPTLVAAAQATERLRVGTLVLNAPFWNPALLARDIATTDLLSGGRLEVGLGAGHMKWEFDEADIEWEPFGRRADRLEALIAELSELFAADGYAQQAALREHFGVTALRPVQRTGFGGYGPPLIVGGTGDRILRIAAATADIIGIAGAFQVPGQPPGTLRIGTADEADERIRFAREHAGERADQVQWQALTQAVVVTDDRRAAAEEFLSRTGPMMTADELLETPFVFIGTVEQMAEQVLRNHERYGFTYYAVHGPYMDTFAPVIERVRAISG
ncbi:probable F420-dependent oxidoreductase, MSMEG_2516 family [Saccharopolyspora kobensis]|uniref:Probable F420-dependent oxidoreductase, MSMEG_2516 family n=2 Tax=Saccharopolyspora kobensis TaxID=146035 RepID=A0A1H5WW80_9PSEU|nr:probable F420-dependent oxidoreductase, MSMEG_2516 family [Saccharopolyspora kobensis]SFD80043.1 probable F420-dependent oxidoreductase, MSMEG_2516 family [Saccharopolyspora kobensis]